ncbi:MAG: DUF3305 domain-containing protein [Betaproteobacteria bacterium]
MEKPTRTLAVIMQRRVTRKRWESVVWEAWSVLESDEPKGPARMLAEQGDVAQWFFAGFDIVLHRDEAEGTYLNVTSPEPSVFVMSRMEDDKAVPQYVTASQYEAARWMDGGEQVDRVLMPGELVEWAREWVGKNYRPEKKKRIKPRSFVSPRDRVE